MDDDEMDSDDVRFNHAERAYEAANNAHEAVPATSVGEMHTSALMAELVAYLTPNHDRERVTIFGWGGNKQAELLARRNAVALEIDRRIDPK